MIATLGGRAVRRIARGRDGAAMADKRRVLIVDDHPVLRRGLAILLGAASDLEVCGEADDVHTAWKAFP